jgi:hypothetical protein
MPPPSLSAPCPFYRALLLLVARCGEPGSTSRGRRTSIHLSGSLCPNPRLPCRHDGVLDCLLIYRLGPAHRYTQGEKKICRNREASSAPRATGHRMEPDASWSPQTHSARSALWWVGSRNPSLPVPPLGCPPFRVGGAYCLRGIRWLLPICSSITCSITLGAACAFTRTWGHRTQQGSEFSDWWTRDDERTKMSFVATNSNERVRQRLQRSVHYRTRGVVC